MRHMLRDLKILESCISYDIKWVNIYYTMVHLYLTYAIVVWGNKHSSNLKKACTFKITVFATYLADIRESFTAFCKLLYILKFDNMVKVGTCVISHPVFLYYLIVPSEQSLTCAALTPDMPPKCNFIEQNE